MNKKQLIFMWLGIAAIIFCAFVTIVDTYRPDYANFGVWVFLVTLVTSGLIYTFRDKKGQEGEKIRRINLRRGFRRITFILAIIAAFIGTNIAVGIVVDKYNSERDNRLRALDFSKIGSNREDTLAGLEEEVATQEPRELRDGFWVTLSKQGLGGLCILAGLGGAVTGYFGVWFVYFLIWLVYRFIRWLVMGFYDINQSR